MLFRTRYNVLFRQFRLLTAQAGSIPAAIRLIFENCYKYLLGTILAAYKEFGDRFAIVEEKLPAIDMVRKAALNKIGRFTKQDIREQCPSLSLSSVEAALRKMVASGELKREGTGKSTCYIRLK